MKMKMVAGIIGLMLVAVAVAGFRFTSPELENSLQEREYQDFIDELDRIGFDALTNQEFNDLADRYQERQEIKDALEAGDYEAYQQAIEVTESEFIEMAEQHQAWNDVRVAIDNMDYDAWANATAQLPNGSLIADIVDEDEFESYVELQKSMIHPGMHRGHDWMYRDNAWMHRGNVRMHEDMPMYWRWTYDEDEMDMNDTMGSQSNEDDINGDDTNEDDINGEEDEETEDQDDESTS